MSDKTSLSSVWMSLSLSLSLSASAFVQPTYDESVSHSLNTISQSESSLLPLLPSEPWRSTHTHTHYITHTHYKTHKHCTTWVLFCHGMMGTELRESHWESVRLGEFVCFILCVCVCVCVWERESVCCVCVCVCVWERERGERERECVCVCVCGEWVCTWYLSRPGDQMFPQGW